MKLQFKYNILLLLCFLVGHTAMAQNQLSQWYFGNQAGINFLTNPPSSLPNSVMNSLQAASSIADASGNLVFYTNGVTVWNNQHLVMANGTGLLGSVDSKQGALIVKQPGNTNIYFVFTTDNVIGGNGLRYSTVDMSLAAGLGSVTAKNTTLSLNSSERLCGVRHCNNTDVWVLSHDYPGDTFRANLVTSTGVNISAVLSSVGAVYTQTSNASGILKASPTGKKLGTATGINEPYFWQVNPFEVYDFDNATGVISNAVPFNYNIYDCEFSPDGTKLYGALTGTFIVQFDLCAGSNTAVEGSAYTFYPSTFIVFRMQRAIDGKIYLPDLQSSDISAITNPNGLGATCNYASNVISLTPNANTRGFPNFVTEIIPPTFNYTNVPTSCHTVSFSANTSTCPALNTAFTSLAWNFGDPSSGALNSSFAPGTTHVYSAPGTYTAQLVLYKPCGTDTVRQVVVIGSLPLSASATTICSGQAAVLTASGNSTYTWSTGANTASTTVSPTVTTVYTVQGNSAPNCLNSGTLMIVVNASPILTITGNNTICPGSNVTFGGSGANSFTWSTGASGPVLNLQSPAQTTYTLFGKNSIGCISQKTIAVIFHTLTPLIISGQTTVCPGSAVSQLATGALSYSWSTGATGASVSLAPVAPTIYTVNGTDINGCITSTTLQIIPQLLSPETSFSYPSPVCLNSPPIKVTKANNFNGGGTFYSDSLSVDSLSGEIKNLSPSGTYIITYVVGPKSCFSAGTGTALLTILPPASLQLNSSMNIAPGGSATLSVSGGDTYTWTPADYLSCTICPQPVVQPPDDQRYCVLSIVNSCPRKACIDVRLSCENGNDFSFPNAFTPNADGYNDAFCLQGWYYCITNFEILIFDRWGEKVFQSDKSDFCWDGTYKSKALNSDVFVYVVSAIFNKTTRVNKKGNITLIR